MANNHQHIEKWLLSELPEHPAEKQKLYQHLRECESCRELGRAWEVVEQQLQQAPVIGPAPGFTARWQARFAVEKRRSERRQTFFILALSISGVFALSAFLALLSLPVLQEPLAFVVTWLYQQTVLLTYVGAVGDAWLTIFRTLVHLVPPTMWMAIGVALGSLSILWIVAISKLTFIKRVAS